MQHTGGVKAKLRRGRNQKMKSDQPGEPPQEQSGSNPSVDISKQATFLAVHAIFDFSLIEDSLVFATFVMALLPWIIL